MDATTLESIKDHIRENEKPKPFPYLDSKGNVTIGAGLLVNKERDFVALDLEITTSAGKRTATKEEKRQAFQRMRADRDSLDGNFNKEAGFYDGKTNVTIAPDVAERELDRRVRERIEIVKFQVGAEAWERLTDGQKATVVDVAYANKDGLKGFPELKQAIRDQNAESIARESVFHSGEDSAGRPRRNWDRVRANYCAAAGLDVTSGECRRAVEKVFDGSGETPKFSDPAPKLRADGEQGDNRLIGGDGADGFKDTSGKSSSGNNDHAAEPQAISAEARVVLDELTKPGRLIDEILLKRPKDLTAGEFLALKKATLELPQGPEQDLLDTMATRFLEATYGTEPVRRDAVGRLIEPQPLRQIPTTPAAPTTADGEPLEAGLRSIGGRIAADAGAGGLSQVVLALQRGLNMLGDAPPPTFVPREKSKSTPPAVLTTLQQPIAEDGLFGSETRGRLRQTLARLGAPKVEEGMALGRFHAFAAGRDDPDGLDQVTERAFGPLFRSPKRTPLRSADRPEAVTLQETLNDLGTEAFSDENFEPLLLDGVIGPKTKSAFSRVRDVFGPERLTRRFGEFLGFL